jgi:hypothetical protein
LIRIKRIFLGLLSITISFYKRYLKFSIDVEGIWKFNLAKRMKKCFVENVADRGNAFSSGI